MSASVSCCGCGCGLGLVGFVGFSFVVWIGEVLGVKDVGVFLLAIALLVLGGVMIRQIALALWGLVS